MQRKQSTYWEIETVEKDNGTKTGQQESLKENVFRAWFSNKAKELHTCFGFTIERHHEKHD